MLRRPKPIETVIRALFSGLDVKMDGITLRAVDGEICVGVGDRWLPSLTTVNQLIASANSLPEEEIRELAFEAARANNMSKIFNA